jgi:predicted DNA-binding transcriptional regulator YafY
VSNILEAETLDQPARRPPDFDLAAWWQEWTRRYERSVYTATATVRMTEAALGRMAFVFPPEMSRVARESAGPPDADGRLITTVPIESVQHGHIELLKLGADAEVLAPEELRERFAETARGMAATYLCEQPAPLAEPAPVSEPAPLAGRTAPASEPAPLAGRTAPASEPAPLAGRTAPAR